MEAVVEQEELNRKNESEEVKEESEKQQEQTEDTSQKKEDKPGFFSRAWSKVKSAGESVVGFGRKGVSWFKGEDDVDSMSDDEFLDHLYSQDTEEDPDYSKRYQELLKELSSMPSLMAFAEKADAKDIKEATKESEKKDAGSQAEESEGEKSEEGAEPAAGEKAEKSAKPAKAAKAAKEEKSVKPEKAAEAAKEEKSAKPEKAAEAAKEEKSTEPAKEAEAAKEEKSAEPAKAAEAAKEEKSAEPAKEAEAAKEEKSAEPAKEGEAAKAEESTEAGKEEESDDILKPLKDQAKELGIDDKKAYKKVEGVADEVVKTKDDVTAAGKAGADIYKSKKRAERLGKMLAKEEAGSDKARKLQYMKDDAEKKASTSGFDVATGVVNTVTKLVSSFAGSKASGIVSKIAGLVNKGLAFGKEKIAQRMDKKAVKNGLKGLIGGSDAYKKLKEKYKIKAPDLRRAIRTAAKASSGKELANADKDKLLEEEET
jgi:hypothetical protein